MSHPLELRVYDRGKLALTAPCPGPAELGRQADDFEVPFSIRANGEVSRIVIAAKKEVKVPRRAFTGSR